MARERLGPYRIVSDLGRGGMGKVHLAVVEEKGTDLAVGSEVALKVIHPHLLESPGFFKRFLREADIGRSVMHENVVRTFDCDQLVLDGVPYSFLVMEYVKGQTLRALLEEIGPVPEGLCRHIATEVAKGVEAVHAAGVVHRDLKPENVLITPEHVVKIMDLGVARLLDEAIRLSQTGSFVGSVHYAAPEQFRGDGDEVDGRADLHALGTMLYELATGVHPFLDDDTRVVLRRVLEERPRPCAELNPQLSPFYEEVVHRLLEKERDARFPSAQALVEVLTQGEESLWWRDRAKALRRRTRRPLRRIRIPRETALHGREAELAALRHAYDRVREGEGQVVLLEGEAGVGKTRLVDEFVTCLEAEAEDLNFLFGANAPGGAATAVGAWSSAFLGHFGNEALEETLRGYLGETPILVPAFAAMLRGEPVPPGEEPLREDSLQTVIVRTSQALAEERPTIVVVEDLQLAPDAGRGLFASLAQAVPGRRLLLIGTMRPGVPPDWVAALERERHVSRMELSRLGARDLTLLLRDAFHSEKLAEKLAGGIALKSDGNPFFVFEIIRGLREASAIAQREDGSWVTTDGLPVLHVPSTVVDLVLARFADLASEDRELLEVAACCGFEFDPVVVAEAAGMERVPALKRLGQIEKRHRLVRSQGHRMVFDHHQVREFLYERTLAPLREVYHAAIAAALERKHGVLDGEPEDLAGADAVELCEHWAAAADPAKTRTWLEAALGHLAGGYDGERALTLADRALGLVGCLEGAARARILLQKSRRLDLQGRRSEQGAALDEALALAESSGDAALLAQVLDAMGWRRFATAEYERAEADLIRSSELSRSNDDAAAESRTLGLLGHVYYRLGRNEEARDHYERWLELARACGERQGAAQAMGSLGNVCFLEGRVEEARELYEAYLGLAHEVENRADEAVATGNLGTLLRFEGRLGDAIEKAERRLTLAREIGDRRSEVIARGNLGALFHLVGAWDEAQAHFESALDSAREVGIRREEGNARHGLAAIAEARGNRKEAEVLCREVLALRRELGDPSAIGEVLLSLGRIALTRGHLDDAWERFGEALERGRSQKTAPLIVLAACCLADVEGGDVSAAEAAFEELGTRIGCTVRMRANFLLWRATRKAEYLEEAKRLLEHVVAHTPAARHEALLQKVELHRDVESAWTERGGGP